MNYQTYNFRAYPRVRKRSQAYLIAKGFGYFWFSIAGGTLRVLGYLAGSLLRGFSEGMGPARRRRRKR